MTIRASAGLYSLDRTTVLSWLTVLRPKAGAASGRTQCGAAESGFIGRRRRLCRALHMPLNGRGLHEWSYKGPVRPFKVFPSLGTPEPGPEGCHWQLVRPALKLPRRSLISIRIGLRSNWGSQQSPWGQETGHMETGHMYAP